MSSLESTIWFSDRLDPERLAHWFGEAATFLGMECRISCGKSMEPNSKETWEQSIGRYSLYEFYGESKWEFRSDRSPIKGKILWPIYKPEGQIGSIQFDMFWQHTRKVSKNSFGEIDALVRFCYYLSYAVSADKLIVDPSDLPSDIIKERYDRMIALGSQMVLTKIDWICGVRRSGDQFAKLELLADSIEPPAQSEDFAIFVLNPQPFDYEIEADRLKVREIEAKMFPQSF
jgi:hypothetical protein